MNGRGLYCSPDGKTVEGYFENDNFVRDLWRERERERDRRKMIRE